VAEERGQRPGGDGDRASPLPLPYGGDWTIRLEVLVTDFAQETLETTATVPR
jgi:hypothetical protein